MLWEEKWSKVKRIGSVLGGGQGLGFNLKQSGLCGAH